MTETALDRLKRWQDLDETVRSWWDTDVVSVEASSEATADAFALPQPYVAGGAPGSPQWYTTMFNWDTHFANLALLVHGRPELVSPHIENYLAMIDRFGYMPNGNQMCMQTRSQVPIVVESIWRYIREADDQELLARAYPRLRREYTEYWLADHHMTPTGLATNRDLGDPSLDARLAAEAETGLDFTTQFEGDVTQTNPVITNSCLVVYADVLEAMARRLGLDAEAERWAGDSRKRAQVMRELCWDEDRGLFMDYNYVQGRTVSVAGASAYWALWAGVATQEQALRSSESLPELLFDHGLSSTEPSNLDPALFALPYEDLQWSYPAGWPPLSIVACAGLDKYGFHDEARLIAQRLIDTIVRNFEETGELYEKYNAVDGSIILPNSRYGTIPLHGWTSASVVLLGRRAELDQTIEEQLGVYAVL